MTIIEKKLIQLDAVDQTKVLLDNNAPLRHKSFDGMSEINSLKINEDDNLEFLAKPISNFMPTMDNDLSTVGYVKDAVAASGIFKLPVVALSVIDVPLTVIPPLVIDGRTIDLEERVALVGQTDMIENGIYVYKQDGLDFFLARALDFDGMPASEVMQGATFDVLFGDTYFNTRFVLKTEMPVIGLTELVFEQSPVPGGGGGVVGEFFSMQVTLNGTDIANQFIIVPGIGATFDQFQLFFFGLLQTVDFDYTLTPVGANLRVDFLSDIMGKLGDIAVAGDVLTLNYRA